MTDTPHRQPRSDPPTTETVNGREARRHARRAALYSYVATALRFPDESTIDDLTDETVQVSIRDAGRELDLSDEVDALLTALEGLDRETLEPAYNDLFGLPGEDGTYAVVPYEAEYATEGDVGETQRRIATLVGLLERFGLEVSEGFDERPDHVAIVLELMQLLSVQRATALTNGNDDAANRVARAGATVLDEHLLDFVPSLAHAVDEVCADSNRTGVAAYASALDLAAALVEADVANHPEPVVPRNGGRSNG